MVTKISIVLMTVLGISVAMNILLFQQVNTLSSLVLVTKSENNQLAQTIDTLDSELLSYKSILHEEQAIQNNVSLKNSDSRMTKSQSITAVGVMPTLVRDGFFERTVFDGTTMDIQVIIRDGEGLILVNTEIPTGVGFQTSAKTAVKVAEEFLNVDLSDKDIIFSITSDDDFMLKAVDGQSAGAAMTVLLISELNDKQIRNDIVMTGTIRPDHSVGMVGGIQQKADAAGEFGAKIFLVPKNQAITHVESCEESRSGTFIYRQCTLEEKPLTELTESLYEMQVFEVEKIDDALELFLEPL